MASPDKKKRKHKKTKRVSRTPSKNSSYSSDESRYQSSHKRRKSKKRTTQAHSPSRDRSRSHRSRRKKSEEKRGASPSALLSSLASGGGFPMMSGFLPMFQPKIPVTLPSQITFQKTAKPPRIMRNPRTQFKGRLYIPYTYDYAMVSANTLKIPKEMFIIMTKNVITQMERRAKEQKQDETVLRKIQQLQEEVQQYYSSKRKEVQEKTTKPTLEETIIQLSETQSLNEFLQNKDLDTEITEIAGKTEVKTNSTMEMTNEKPISNLMKEAKEVLSKLG